MKSISFANKKQFDGAFEIIKKISRQCGRWHDYTDSEVPLLVRWILFRLVFDCWNDADDVQTLPGTSLLVRKEFYKAPHDENYWT